MIEAKVTRGTPQGGVLSPLVGWNLAMNSLIKELKKGPCKATAFADDIGLVVSSIDLTVAVDTMQSAINKACEWATRIGVKFSSEKSKYMITTKKKIGYMGKTVQIEGKELERVKAYKYLGVTIDDKLN